LVGAAATALWLKQQSSPEKLRAAVAQLPGLCATAMFTLSPLPQLVRCPAAGTRQLSEACCDLGVRCCSSRHKMRVPRLFSLF
jgi:hypothetical protein